nr:MAG TPA: Putative head tail adaptor [Caudoviricetes sp.]
MEIGNLNQRITILEHRTVVDEIGNHITKWEENFSLWAKVTVKTATETTDAEVVKEVQKLEFLVRQSPASLNINSTNFRILFRNNIYNVTGITPLYDHNNYMKIEGEIRKAGASDGYS